jgi:hypothetical protein
MRTLEEACALVGTTWERDGKRRTITSIEDLRMSGDIVVCYIHWKTPDGKQRKKPTWVSSFEEWRSKAVQVQDDEKDSTCE